jgi:hypothetical protein
MLCVNVYTYSTLQTERHSILKLTHRLPKFFCQFRDNDNVGNASNRPQQCLNFIEIGENGGKFFKVPPTWLKDAFRIVGPIYLTWNTFP